MTFKEFFKPFLSNLLDVVLEKAMADGVITPEESVLLSQIEVDVRAFEKEIAKQIEEGGKDILQVLGKDTFKDRLIASVKRLAMADGKISADEEAILVRLEEYFREHEIITE